MVTLKECQVLFVCTVCYETHCAIECRCIINVIKNDCWCYLCYYSRANLTVYRNTIFSHNFADLSSPC